MTFEEARDIIDLKRRVTRQELDQAGATVELMIHDARLQEYRYNTCYNVPDKTTPTLEEFRELSPSTKRRLSR